MCENRNTAAGKTPTQTWPQSHHSAVTTEAENSWLSMKQEGMTEQLISTPNLRSPTHAGKFDAYQRRRKTLVLRSTDGPLRGTMT